jgi:hypothetical protein
MSHRTSTSWPLAAVSAASTASDDIGRSVAARKALAKRPR